MNHSSPLAYCGGRFVPLFAAPSHAGTAERYRQAGLEVAFLDLERFRPSTLLALRGLTRRLAIEVAGGIPSSPALIAARSSALVNQRASLISSSSTTIRCPLAALAS